LRKAKAGHNLAAKRPDLAAEWSPRNTISPSEVTPGTKRYVWWWCKACGYEWKSMINNRNRGFGKCPRCRGSVASETNNLAVKRPDLVAEWSPRNTLKPTEVRCGDKTKMWWVCKVCGHEWEKEINLRCHAEIGCPECRVTKRVSGGNSLASFPHLVAEWSPRNVLSPSRVPPKRTTNYWWVCGKCGHEWEATPGNRTKGSGCPECVRKERVARFKRFAAMRRKGNDQGIQEWIAGKLLRFNQRKEQEHEQEIQERSA
jgi:rubrerythrin